MHARVLRLPSLTHEHPIERMLRLLLVLCIAFGIASYIYFIAASTFNIIARKQAESTAIATQSRLADINSQYYALSQRVTPGEAGVLGLVPLKNKSYVTRTTSLGFAGAENN